MNVLHAINFCESNLNSEMFREGKWRQDENIHTDLI